MQHNFRIYASTKYLWSFTSDQSVGQSRPLLPLWTWFHYLQFHLRPPIWDLRLRLRPPDHPCWLLDLASPGCRHRRRRNSDHHLLPSKAAVPPPNNRPAATPSTPPSPPRTRPPPRPYNHPQQRSRRDGEGKRPEEHTGSEAQRRTAERYDQAVPADVARRVAKVTVGLVGLDCQTVEPQLHAPAEAPELRLEDTEAFVGGGGQGGLASGAFMARVYTAEAAGEGYRRGDGGSMAAGMV